MKKVLALILVLLMAMSVLVACGDKKDETTTTVATNADVPATTLAEAVTTVPVTTEPAVISLTNENILGKWNMVAGLDSLFEAYMALEADGQLEGMEDFIELYKSMFSGVNLYINIEFMADGKYEVALDEAKMETFAADIAANVVEFLKDGGLEQILTMGGAETTIAQLEEALAKEGKTLDDYYEMMAEQLMAEIDPESLTASLGNGDGEYELTEETLFIDMGDAMGVSSNFKYEYDGEVITLLENAEGQMHPFSGATLTKIG